MSLRLLISVCVCVYRSESNVSGAIRHQRGRHVPRYFDQLNVDLILVLYQSSSMNIELFSNL